uniref:Gsh1 n=1 Tax=Arundo donax TaxID=35708 RepID=A0A0A9UHG2_ARUDO
MISFPCILLLVLIRFCSITLRIRYCFGSPAWRERPGFAVVGLPTSTWKGVGAAGSWRPASQW